MHIKVPTKNIIINLDELSHIYIGSVDSNKADMYFVFKSGKTLISTFDVQRKPYKAALDVAQEVIEELAKAIEKARENHEQKAQEDL